MRQKLARALISGLVLVLSVFANTAVPSALVSALDETVAVTNEPATPTTDQSPSVLAPTVAEPVVQPSPPVTNAPEPTVSDSLPPLVAQPTKLIAPLLSSHDTPQLEPPLEASPAPNLDNDSTALPPPTAPQTEKYDSTLNHPEYWQGIFATELRDVAVTCTKYEPVTTPFTVPAPQSGQKWYAAVIKSGSDADANEIVRAVSTGDSLAHASGRDTVILYCAPCLQMTKCRRPPKRVLCRLHQHLSTFAEPATTHLPYIAPKMSFIKSTIRRLPPPTPR